MKLVNVYSSGNRGSHSNSRQFLSKFYENNCKSIVPDEYYLFTKIK